MEKIDWQIAKEYEDLTYKKCNGVARIAFNRPEVRNAFQPKTVFELIDLKTPVTTVALAWYYFRAKARQLKTAVGRFVAAVTSEPEGKTDTKTKWA
jgi:hypothetical protein